MSRTIFLHKCSFQITFVHNLIHLNDLDYFSQKARAFSRQDKITQDLFKKVAQI